MVVTNKGLFHIYTGNGKGKTTVPLGLALHAVGARKKVLFIQFLKQAKQSEHASLKRFSDQITFFCYGTGEFIGTKTTKQHSEVVRKGLQNTVQLIAQCKYDLVILDEVIVALHYNLFSLEELLDVVRNRPLHTEMVLTGRNATPILMEYADLVTEMVEVKHYFHKGIPARKGIEM